ncbi:MULTISPECIES: hypothetical protein [Bacillus]|jgi:hypothetical protein|uniref:Uncharacterized protein n=4 Tax=Bacillus cereus group TaxID=86661 RepID=A0A0J1HT74_BACAN|nr:MULTISPECIES: hypothetical protein [Bacillus]ADY21820.1 hypothetical protein YBT020_12910 [Bacillus thuringiensis serovar finitimus YBT-020]OTX73785.1 hypothetical protein BK722_08755 [Bacillus thuringiensis serovar finitimus]AAT59982.1 hypothetical protein BT9727_2370 [[Bacillus thuringiensis] serovar konkukian str. 97-27]AAU17921.1 hypothetical protein BCE33L2335 [Bacillus cereus E33L]AJI28742.1 putative membrane protein [Bacillus cereus E33L]
MNGLMENNLRTLFLLFVSIIVLVFQIIVFVRIVRNWFKTKNIDKLKEDTQYIKKLTIIYIGIMVIGAITNLPLFGFILLGFMSNTIILMSLKIELSNTKSNQLKTVKNSKLMLWFVMNTVHLVLFFVEGIKLIKSI